MCGGITCGGSTLQTAMLLKSKIVGALLAAPKDCRGIWAQQAAPLRRLQRR